MIGTELPALEHVAEGRLASGPATESTSDQESSKLLLLSKEESCDWQLTSCSVLGSPPAGRTGVPVALRLPQPQTVMNLSQWSHLVHHLLL